VLLGAAAAVAGAAVWFTFLQIVVLRAICPWCMAAHGIGLALALGVAAAAPVGSGRLSLRAVAAATVVGTAAAGTLVGVQVMWPAATHEIRFGTGRDFDEGSGRQRQMSFFGGLVRVRPHELPMLGSADAPFVVAYVYDYTCVHCRTAHGQIRTAMQAYGDRLGVLLLCAPNDAACNPALLNTSPAHEGACELARLSAAVWVADHGQFAAFHDWLFEPAEPRSPQQASEHAAALVGADVLADALADPFVSQQIQRSLAFQQLHERASLPLLVARNTVIHGRPRDAQVVIDFVAAAFGVEAPHLRAEPQP
jgi:hypothetical protein